MSILINNYNIFVNWSEFVSLIHKPTIHFDSKYVFLLPATSLAAWAAMPVIQHPFPVTTAQLVSKTDRKTVWITSGAWALHHISFHSQIKVRGFSWKVTLLTGEGVGPGPGLGSRRKAVKCLAKCLRLVLVPGVPYSTAPFSQYC